MSQALWSSPSSHSSLTRRSLGEDAGEVVVAAVVAGDQGVDAASTPRSTRVFAERAEAVCELVEVAGLDAEGVGDLLQRGAAAGPELAVLPVPEELVGLA